MKKYLKIFGCVLLIMFGIFIFIYGGYDDSPGAQLLGVVVCVFGVVKLIRINKK